MVRCDSRLSYDVNVNNVFQVTSVKMEPHVLMVLPSIHATAPEVLRGHYAVLTLMIVYQLCA